jgi:hypothetical protein
MAAITGKSGTILYAGGSVATIKSWSMDIDTDMHDVTSLSTGTVQWRTFAAGISGWTGSAEGTFDSASTGQNNMIVATLAATTAAIVLEMDKDAGGSFTGGCHLEQMSVGVDIDNQTDISWNLQGSGTLTYSTTT